MTWEEIKKWLDENKDNGDLKKYLLDNSPEAKINTEIVDKFVTTDDGATWLQSKVDQKVQSGIETFKDKTMPGLITEAVDAKVKEINPEETPEQKRIRELEDKQEASDKNLKQERLEKVALQTLSAKKLTDLNPLVKIFIGDDETATLTNITEFEKGIKVITEAAIKEALPGRKPPAGPGRETEPGFKNPFEEGDHFNLTEQGKIYKESPEEAARLQKLAEGN